MLSLDVFLPHLQPWLLAAPEPLTRAALLRAARDFCERTHVVQGTIGPVNATVGQADFPLTTPTDQELVRVKRAWWGTTELYLVSPEEVGSPLAYVSSVNGASRVNGTPQEAYLTGPATLTLAAPADKAATAALTVRAVFRPTLAATTVADELYNDWLEAIVAKAAMILAAVPGAAMAGAELMAMAPGIYETQVARASDIARRGRHQASLRVRGNPFA